LELSMYNEGRLLTSMVYRCEAGSNT